MTVSILGPKRDTTIWKAHDSISVLVLSLRMRIIIFFSFIHEDTLSMSVLDEVWKWKLWLKFAIDTYPLRTTVIELPQQFQVIPNIMFSSSFAYYLYSEYVKQRSLVDSYYFGTEEGVHIMVLW